MKINDLTIIEKLRVTGMLEGETYRITFTTGDYYDVLVCYKGNIYLSYDENQERIVVFLEDGSLNIINDDIVAEIMKINIEANITN